MIAGIKLSSSEEEISGVAFLEDEVESRSLKTDEEILEILKEKEPEIIAFSVKLTSPERGEEYREGEEELIEEGYSPVPYGLADTKKLQERAQSLRARLKGLEAQFIECDSMITCEVLDITGDVDLKSYGLETKEIENTMEFEAVVIALTGLFFQRGDYEDHDIIIPDLKEE